jgi:hypothetical protein
MTTTCEWVAAASIHPHEVWAPDAAPVAADTESTPDMPTVIDATQIETPAVAEPVDASQLAEAPVGDAPVALCSLCRRAFGVVVDAMVRLTCASWLPLDGLFGRGGAACLGTKRWLCSIRFDQYGTQAAFDTCFEDVIFTAARRTQLDRGRAPAEGDTGAQDAFSGQFRMHVGHTRETIYRDADGNILYSAIHRFEEIFGGHTS